jgi:hypothetical protein
VPHIRSSPGALNVMLFPVTAMSYGLPGSAASRL